MSERELLVPVGRGGVGKRPGRLNSDSGVRDPKEGVSVMETGPDPPYPANRDTDTETVVIPGPGEE